MSLRYQGGYAIPSGATPPPVVDYLVVAGGAGGFNGSQYYSSPGGAAGGVFLGNGYPTTPGTAIVITIGSGGAGATVYPASPTAGSNSSLGGIVTTGGSVTGSYLSGNGNGIAYSANYGGAGGGGATSPGGWPVGGDTSNVNGSSQSASGGGCGAMTPITGTAVGYGGGGGGGFNGYQVNFYRGFGSAGGGNADPKSYAYGIRHSRGAGSSSAKSNTGGGGGGGASDGNANATVGPAGNGGSGVVVLRYPSVYAPASAVTGSPTTYVYQNQRVYIFNASGSITF